MAPAVEVIKVDTVNMMAMSISDTEVDTSGHGVQLGREISSGAKDLDLLWD